MGATPFKVIKGGGRERPGPRFSALAIRISVEWDASVLISRRLVAISKMTEDTLHCSRLTTFSYVFRGHASRLLSRLVGFGRGPLPVTDEVDLGSLDVDSGLRAIASMIQNVVNHSIETANIARTDADLSTAWVCELNRAEGEDALKGIREILAERTRGAAQLQR